VGATVDAGAMMLFVELCQRVDRGPLAQSAIPLRYAGRATIARIVRAAGERW
jgi:hypothetical protein